jgi:hypothetical protein
MEEIVCCSCEDLCERSVRHKNQRYCPKPGCQRARKAAWKRYKMRTDLDYRFNQRLSSQTWAKAHPDDWRAYRKRHLEKAERNRLLQVIRNRHRRRKLAADHSLIAKVDALKANISDIPKRQA